MADVVKSTMDWNVGTAITSNAGAASQTIVCDRGDEKVLIRMSNADAATALVTFTGAGFGGATAKTVTLAQNDVKGIYLESFFVKSPSTQKITATITNANGTTYSGTVTNIKIEVIEAPKGIVD